MYTTYYVYHICTMYTTYYVYYICTWFRVYLALFEQPARPRRDSHPVRVVLAHRTPAVVVKSTGSGQIF